MIACRDADITLLHSARGRLFDPCCDCRKHCITCLLFHFRVLRCQAHPELCFLACSSCESSKCTCVQGGYGQAQGMAPQAPQGGYAPQNGPSFGTMTGGTSALAQAPPSAAWAGGQQQQQGLPQQTPPRAPTRKEAAAVHDPFAALTGQHICSPEFTSNIKNNMKL